MARILVEPAGTAVILRTPLFRSARFASVDEARAYAEGQHAETMPLLLGGGAAAVTKVLLPEEWQLVAILSCIAAGVIGGVVVSRRARMTMPTPIRLGWDESVWLDDELPTATQIVKDGGLTLASLALLGLFGVLIEDGGLRELREHGVAASIGAGVFFLALGVGVVAGVGSAVQRVRFLRTKRLLRG